MAKINFESIDQYIDTFPGETQKMLRKVRKVIKKIIPEATETISYQIPTFKLNGKYVIYFAGWKNHISIYPIPRVDKKLQKEIEPLIKGRGTLSFSLKEDLPFELIEKVVKLRLKESETKVNY